MATKEQNLKRLDELARILGREPDISGSAAEIAQRVAEWEEEAEDSEEIGEEGAGDCRCGWSQQQRSG